MEPPILSQYSDAPVYEVTTMVQMLRVRPLALWTWEQHLGISTGESSAESNPHKRRYSERDLAALLWLRDRVIAGETPQDATARLLGAQRGMRGLGYGVSGALSSGPLTLEPSNQGPAPFMTSGALSSGALYTSPPHANQPPAYDPTQRGMQHEPFPTPSGDALGTSTYPTGYPTGYPAGGGSSRRTGGLGRSGQLDPWANDPWNTEGRPGTSDTHPNGFTTGFSTGTGPQTGGPSGRLGAIYGAALEPPAFPTRGYTMSQSLSSLRELRPAVPQLLSAFARFDTARANAVMTEALRHHGVDNVCIGLAQPAVIRISELWSKSELSNPEERFGLNYLREFMFAVFHSTSEPLGAPFAVIGCAPNETGDFGALLLAVLWRRAGLRVAYLGRGVDGDQLVQEPWPVTPAIIALTATTAQRVRTLARIAKRVAELPTPQPVFAYWGPVFVRNPELRRKVNAVYLGDDAATATHHARQLANLEVYSE